MNEHLTATYGKLRYFCPYCELELNGKHNGATHINVIQAWNRLECEYIVGVDERPIVTSIDRLNSDIAYVEKQIRELPQRLELLQSLRRGLLDEAKTTSTIESKGEELP